MSSTPSEQNLLFLLDPWNMTKAGWLDPRVVRLSEVANVYQVEAPEIYVDNVPLLIYAPNRGFDEFFLVEFRTPNLDRENFVSYDIGVLGEGVAVWYNQVNEIRDLLGFTWPPPFDGPTEPFNAFSSYLVGPNGFARGPFWNEDHGALILAWGDGTESPYRLRVRSDHSGESADIYLYEEGTPLYPRIDSISPLVTSPGGELVISGMFPFDFSNPELGGTLTILFADFHGNQRTTNLTRHRINATPSELHIHVPNDIPLGQYMLYVISEHASNGIRIKIQHP